MVQHNFVTNNTFNKKKKNANLKIKLFEKNNKVRKKKKLNDQNFKF